MKTQLHSDKIIQHNFDKVLSISGIEIKVKEMILKAFMVAKDKRILYQQIVSFVENEIKKIKLDDIEKYKKSIDYWTKFWISKYYNDYSNILMLALIQIERTGAKTDGMIKYTSTGKKLPVPFKIIDFMETKQSQLKEYPLASSKVANYYQEFKNVTESFIQNGFKEMPELVNGKIVHGRTLFAKTERQVRFEYHQEQLAELRAKGVQLVWINSHANCSKRCEKFQGKLYSLNGTHGYTVEGYQYKPIEKAIDVYVFTKSGTVWKNGLFGFNCRHRMIPYVQGSIAPATIPAAVIEKQRKIDSIQRQMERQIFEMRKEAYLLRSVPSSSFCLRKAKMLEKKATSLFKDYVSFSKANKRVWYPERCRISLY